jgi:type IV pilus assembly protein PilF
MIKKLHFLLLVASVFMVACTGGQENLKEKKNARDLKRASEINVQLAVGYLKREQYKVSKEKLDKAINQDPTNVDAYTTMAFLMMQLNEMSEAENYYLEALDIKGKNPELRNNYGTYLCKVGRIDEAVEEFRLAYTNPFYDTPYLAYSNAGTCLLQAGDYKKSETFLRKALRKQPKLSGALLSMAELGVKTKKYLMARAYSQRYHAINAPSARSLWLQVQAERALGATEHYRKYAKQILSDFPDSDEAGWVEELVDSDRIRED